ncbi:MAG: hypothetical protein ABII21_00860 [bacterium]
MPDDNDSVSEIFQAIEFFRKFNSNNQLKANEIKISHPIIISYTAKPDILIFAPNDQFATEILSKQNISLIGSKLNYNVYNTKGKIPPDSTWLTGWRYGPLPNFLHHIFAPTHNQSKYITGPTSEVFLSNQNRKLFGLENPYKYMDGFYATIIHELGHASIAENTKSLDTKFVEQFFSHNTSKLFYPEKWFLPELFAFCTEYSFSISNLPKHAKKLEKLQSKILKLMQNKTIPWYTTHTYAITTGIALITKHPHTWPNRLIDRVAVSI